MAAQGTQRPHDGGARIGRVSAPERRAGRRAAHRAPERALLAEARALQPRTLALRRLLHRNPEIGLALPVTQAAVLSALRDMPLEVGTGRRCSSVVAVLRGARPGPAVLVRADMDALPMDEDTDLPFASEVD